MPGRAAVWKYWQGMIVESLELKNFRNYERALFAFDPGTNILYGDNAQGKTNVLEALQVCSTTKSQRGSRDAEMIRFGEEEAHIRLFFKKHGITHKIDIHLRKNGKKGAAVDGIPIRRAADLLGQMHIVSFFPEDLRIIKNSPRDRRRFLDSQLCQLDRVYTSRLTEYNKIVAQRNALLKDARFADAIGPTLDVWDEQMAVYGGHLIRQREKFLLQLNELVKEIHAELTGGKEQIELCYEPDVEAGRFAEELRRNREKDLKWKVSSIGPHRDDFQVKVNGIDIRHYGSQGQQRSAALSLKLSEIRLVRETIKDTPILLLDDVLSELDSSRQKMLLQGIENVQIFLTCTGMDGLTAHQFPMNKVFHIVDGNISKENIWQTK